MEKIKGLLHDKRFLMFLMVGAVCISSTFAEDTFGLNSKVQILVDLISSPWVKGIACIAFVVECIGLVTAGRQEPGDVQEVYSLDCRDDYLYGGGNDYEQIPFRQFDDVQRRDEGVGRKIWRRYRIIRFRFTRASSSPTCSWGFPR